MVVVDRTTGLCMELIDLFGFKRIGKMETLVKYYVRSIDEDADNTPRQLVW